ncbi:MAG: thermostable hemolysin [Planctomycetota bacterium]
MAPAPSPRLQLCLDHASQRDVLAATVREVYARCYGARIEHLLPILLGLEAAAPSGVSRQVPAGVIGAQLGRDPARMFLEEYLDEPVESALSRALGRAVPRSLLAEVGNLSGQTPGLGRALVSTMAAFLDGAGVEWSVFTATRALRAAFLRMGLQLLDLGEADGRRLGGRLSDWGTYYETDPRLTAVPVAAMRAVAARDASLVDTCGAAWNAAFARGRLLARHVA